MDKKELKKILKIEQKEAQLAKLEKEMGQPNFWQNQEKAQRLSKKYAGLKELLDSFHSAKTKEELEELEIMAILSNKFDQHNAIISISAGTGGADAQDWSEMLMRMYLRFCQNQNWQTELIDQQPGKEAGIRSATIYTQGNFAHGLLKAESGVHRLVRKSPFNAQSLRQTSFALVDVAPEVETEEAELKEADLEIDTFRSSGPGGQSVNTTDSAVRIKHKPTDLTVSVQNEKSQLKNKQLALKILSAKLAKLEEDKIKDKINSAKGETKAAQWGNQIRSYILDPYQLVKDHRTEQEEKNVDKVLGGQLMNFIKSYLKKEASR